MEPIKAGRGRKTNHKRGIAAAKKAKRRQEAEERNARYAKLSKAEKLAQAGLKVRKKLLEEEP